MENILNMKFTPTHNYEMTGKEIINKISEYLEDDAEYMNKIKEKLTPEIMQNFIDMISNIDNDFAEQYEDEYPGFSADTIANFINNNFDNIYDEYNKQFEGDENSESDKFENDEFNESKMITSITEFKKYITENNHGYSTPKTKRYKIGKKLKISNQKTDDTSFDIGETVEIIETGRHDYLVRNNKGQQQVVYHFELELF